MRSLSRLLVVLCALTVVGCAQLSMVRDSILKGGDSLVASVENPVGRDELATLENSYGIVLTGLVTYKRLCIKKQADANCRSNVVMLQGYQKHAQSAVLAARRFVRENPTLSAFSAISAARNAISDFKTAAISTGAIR